MRNFSPLAILAAVGAAVLFMALVFAAPSESAEGPPPPPGAGMALPAPEGEATSGETPEGTEVLTRGPVHEAFATPIELNPQTTPIVKKQPPAPIEEVPPDQKPEGDNVIWIPGYFAWDDDREDYIWISGVWRNVPPNQTWVAGYWNQAAEGYQWTPGFWTAAKKSEVNYLAEAPPTSLEAGPNTPQPSENHFWIPGNWVYQTHYAWQPGYWAVTQPNWIWMPAHYVWTPGGYIFVGGFWDYTPAYRGCLFAPVAFAPGIYARPHFVFSPGVVINVGFFSANLFCRPAYCHYYFGDYYAARYAGIGIRPFFEVSIGNRVGYDPLFNYYRWKNGRTDPNWMAQQRQHFELLQKNAADRPPRTFLAQEQMMKKGDFGNKKSDFLAGTTLQQAAKNPNSTGFKLQAVSQQNREEMLKQAQTFNKFSQQRSDNEKQALLGGGAGAGGGTGTAKPAQTLKLPTIATQQNRNPTGQNFSQQMGNSKELGAGNNAQKFNRQNVNPGLATENPGTAVEKNKTNEQFQQGGTGKSVFGQQGAGQAGGMGRQQEGAGQQSNAGEEAFQRRMSGAQFGQQGGGAGSQSNSGGQEQGGSGQPNPGTPKVFSQQGGSGQGGFGQQGAGQQSGAGQQGMGQQGGSGKSNVLMQQGGGQQMQRMNSGGQKQPPPKPDKDDDPNQKKNNNRSSSDTSPKTNFSMQRNSGAELNAHGVADTERAATQHDLSHKTDNWAKEALDDKLTNDKEPSAKPSRSADTQQQLSKGTGLQGASGTSGSAGNGNASQANDRQTPKGINSPTSGLGINSGPVARSSTDTSNNSPGVPSIYRNLMQRGRSLSQSTGGSGQAGSSPGSGTTADVDPRLKKDPIGSYGYGSSPVRFPGAAAPYSMGGGQGPAAGQSVSAGYGSGGGIQRYTPAELPRLQRGMGNSTYGAAGNSDPASRTYDPNNQNNGTYDPGR